MKQYIRILGRISLVVLVSFVWLLPSFAQQAFYVYRNDGIINTFFTSDVDSMVCSTIDVDSIMHREYVVQEIYTLDTIYRIPLERIDSVSFVTPETKYKPGVRVLEGELKDYIMLRDSMTIIFQSNTPNDLLPKVGDKLVSTVADDVLGGAFLGQVETIESRENGIEVVCVPVDLMEIFEYYYGVVRKEKDDESQKQTRGLSDGFYSTGMRRLSPGKLSYDLFNNHDWDLSYSVDDDLSLGISKTQATLSVTPVVDYSAYLIVNKDYGVNISITAIGNYTMEELFALKGNVNFSDEQEIWQKTIFIPEAFIDFKFEFGVFCNVAAEISLEQIFKQEYRHVFHWEWSSKGHSSLRKTNQWLPLASTHDGNMAMNGEWSVGAYGKMGISFIGTSSFDIEEIALKAEGGLLYEGNFVPHKSDFEQARLSTNLYKTIKDSELSAYWFYGLKAEAKLFKWSVSHEVPDFYSFPLNRKECIASVRSVPEFSGTTLDWLGNGMYSASAKVVGVVDKTDLGFALINQKNNEDAAYIYSIMNYQGEQADMVGKFFNKSRSADYTLYPLVKYMGMELIAEPSAVDENIPEIKTLQAISVSECAATLQGEVNGIKNPSGCRFGFFFSTSSVPEVGGQDLYVGSDKDGVYTYTLSDLKENTTYYYCAYLFVDGSYTYGEVRSFTTGKKNDEITPGQMVDLGLSVKWAGWNVGATKPEEYGGYYAWGEFEEKEDYWVTTYQHYNQESREYVFIGNDISSTEYDVAHVKWGGNWRMPTRRECQELIDKCIWTWITYKGVNGQKVTGPNGNSIFLPAAGACIGQVNGINLIGYYWSATFGDDTNKFAFCLRFDGYDLLGHYNFRSDGRSVRAVSE